MYYTVFTLSMYIDAALARSATVYEPALLVNGGVPSSNHPNTVAALDSRQPLGDFHDGLRKAASKLLGVVRRFSQYDPVLERILLDLSRMPLTMPLWEMVERIIMVLCYAPPDSSDIGPLHGLFNGYFRLTPFKQKSYINDQLLQVYLARPSFENRLPLGYSRELVTVKAIKKSTGPSPPVVDNQLTHTDTDTRSSHGTGVNGPEGEAGTVVQERWTNGYKIVEAPIDALELFLCNLMQTLSKPAIHPCTRVYLARKQPDQSPQVKADA